MTCRAVRTEEPPRIEAPVEYRHEHLTFQGCPEGTIKCQDCGEFLTLETLDSVCAGKVWEVPF